MKKGLKINIGAFQTLMLESSERETTEECNMDLQNLITDYERKTGMTIEEIQKDLSQSFPVNIKKGVGF